jgi:diaminohydroxyphosphoribosylaminopyrimidine deaminase/5-amino-6-(5-phosphoribosylamino)uracil reductase
MVTDDLLMARALFHAARAAGATAPNPMVGAVIVSRDGVVVGQGRHSKAGEPHAEINALEEAGERARGGTLFVSLEPCCHQGRTGPCTSRVVASGIARVVVAMEDPDPRVRGRGLAVLRAAGLRVDLGLHAADARRLNRPFVTVQTLGRPFVIVKAAVSRDGRIAARPGVRTAITSAGANRRTQRLRSMVDAIGVGSGTVLADDPRLTVRETVRARPLVRVVFDRRLRIQSTARLFSTLGDGPVIILTSATARDTLVDRVRALERAGAHVVAAAENLDADVRGLLKWDVSSFLVEGGAQIHRALFAANLVDEAHVVVSPMRIGAEGVPVFGGLPDPLAGLSPGVVQAVGPDVWMEFDVHGDRRVGG